MAEENIPMLSIPNVNVCNNDKDEQGGSGGKSRAKIRKAWKKDTDIDLFLLGKTGHGKSAAGNSILMREAFKSDAAMTSVTTVVDFNYTEFNGRVIKVVDTPGVHDTSVTTEDTKDFFFRQIESAIVGNPKGYHAFLIVFRLGSRFTKEENETITILKALFGETFVRDHCILVMTFGDMFASNDSLKGMSFEMWCDKQKGPFKELLIECSNRIVLFDNVTKDKATKKKQVVELLHLVAELKGRRYTDVNFKQAQLAQAEFEVEYFTESALIESCLILEMLKFCQESSSDEQESLENLYKRTKYLVKNLSKIDTNTSLHQDMKNNVSHILFIIDLELQINAAFEECKKSSCSDADKMRLKKELDKTFKKFERKYKCEESELYDYLINRREVLKLERERGEENYENLTLRYILTFVPPLLEKLRFFFTNSWKRIRNFVCLP